MTAAYIEAAERGVASAGFANPRGEARAYDISVAADCPCGLGTSRFAIRFHPTELHHARLDNASIIEHQFRQLALRHIEHDRAEGRWT